MINIFKNKSGIYQWRNLVNGKIYVGSGVDLNDRRLSHRTALRGEYHANDYLQNAWDNYGEENFVFELIEYCAVSFLLGREQYYLDYYESYNRKIGYNIAHKAGSRYGTKHSDATKQKMSEDRKGKSQPPFTEEHKLKISAANKGNTRNKGKILTEETKEKLRQANLGKKVSEETKKKISEANTGKKHTEETLEKMRNRVVSEEYRDILRNRIVSEETKEKMRIAATGKVLSEETKKKISDGNKGKKVSEETLEKMKNRVITEETKKKISEAATGREHLEETKKKISESNKGKSKNVGHKHSEETKIKMKESRKGYTHSEETKKKLKDTWKKRKEEKAKQLAALGMN